MTKTQPYPAPTFTLPDTLGKVHSLEDYAGKWVVLYFYPKDDTPGCTVEACSLRDANSDITALGAEIIGISADDAKSHESFEKKHQLNFTLLSDPEKTAIEAYGAWGPKMFGKVGILRKTFIISPEGEIIKVYGRVTPEGHGDQIVSDLKSLQA